jgi:hypothetical protein
MGSDSAATTLEQGKADDGVDGAGCGVLLYRMAAVDYLPPRRIERGHGLDRYADARSASSGIGTKARHQHIPYQLVEWDMCDAGSSCDRQSPHPTGAANEGAERAEATITVTEMASRSAYYQTLDTSIAREDLAWRRTLYMRLNHLGDNSSSMAPDDLAQALTCQRIDLQTDLVAAG